MIYQTTTFLNDVSIEACMQEAGFAGLGRRAVSEPKVFCTVVVTCAKAESVPSAPSGDGRYR